MHHSVTYKKEELMFTSKEENPSKTSERVKRRDGVDEDRIKERKLGKRNHEKSCLKLLIDKEVTIRSSYFCLINYMQACSYTL